MAETNKKQRPIAIPETKGTFSVSGHVYGVLSKRFYSESVTQNGQSRRSLQFAVQVDPENKVYVELSAAPTDRVYFSKNIEENGKRSASVESVKWADRKSKAAEALVKDGYRMMGVSVGIERKIDERGTESNDVVTLAPYDAAEYLSSHLRDDMPVLVRGNIRYSSYNGRRYRRFEITHIYYSKKVETAHTDPNAEPNQSDFHCRFVYTGIAADPSKSTRQVISAKIIGYNTVEDTEFLIENGAIAQNIRRNIKPYSMIEVDGNIVNRKLEEDVADQGCWGTPNRMSIRRAPTVTEMIICAVYPDKTDSTVYNEQSVSEAIAAAKANRQARSDYGEQNSAASNFSAPQMNYHTTISNEKSNDAAPWDDEDGWED